MVRIDLFQTETFRHQVGTPCVQILFTFGNLAPPSVSIKNTFLTKHTQQQRTTMPRHAPGRNPCNRFPLDSHRKLHDEGYSEEEDGYSYDEEADAQGQGRNMGKYHSVPHDRGKTKGNERELPCFPTIVRMLLRMFGGVWKKDVAKLTILLTKIILVDYISSKFR